MQVEQQRPVRPSQLIIFRYFAAGYVVGCSAVRSAVRLSWFAQVVEREALILLVASCTVGLRSLFVCAMQQQQGSVNEPMLVPPTANPLSKALVISWSPSSAAKPSSVVLVAEKELSSCRNNEVVSASNALGSPLPVAEWRR